MSNPPKLKLKQEFVDRKCQICGCLFTTRSHLLRHQRTVHQTIINQKKNTSNNEIIELLISMKKDIAELKKKEKVKEKEKEKEKEKPVINFNNNVLQVVCVSPNDNYLDILTKQLGNFNDALKYIKNCALADINGDCQLIEKIYLGYNRLKPVFYYLNKSRTRVEYFNEKNELISDKKIQFCNKLANNLQNSYLKGVNHAINETLNNNKCPNKFLEEYDIQTWNQHIYSLSDENYQKKLINQLSIPCKSEIL